MRHIIAKEGEVSFDHWFIVPEGVKIDADRVPVTVGFYPDEPPVGWAKDFKREGNELTAEVEWSTPSVDDKFVKGMDITFMATDVLRHRFLDVWFVDECTLALVSFVPNAANPKLPTA